MNKEDYVSFEVAKLLEEQGCNLESDKYYIGGRYTESYFVQDANDTVVSAPTLYEAQKWLKNLGYYVEVCVIGKNEWEFIIYNLIDEQEPCVYMKSSKNKYNTYEEALNEGIKEALKLI